jgi:hypothetical protein
MKQQLATERVSNHQLRLQAAAMQTQLEAAGVSGVMQQQDARVR